MSTDISSMSLLATRRRVARLGLGAALAFAALAFAALGGGCAEDPPAPVTPPMPDAGPACEPGTAGCVCPCEENLLCISGRCLETEGPREPPVDSRPRPRPTQPPTIVLDAGPEPAPPDAGPAPSESPDADVPDASD
jgi:hypothetical protein